jgi:hypothetical protein
MKIKTKLIITTLLLCVINITAYSQFDKFTTYEELGSIAREYFQSNNLDSAIVVREYARIKFPEHDKNATLILDFLYLRNNQDSKSLENWDYGLKKRYFFGLSLNWNKDRFKDNPEFNRLAKIDKQIGDSLSNLAHVEYEVVLPANYSTDKEYPILFVFHGNDRNLQQVRTIWTTEVIKDEFIAVYLQSYIYMSKSAYQWKLDDEKTNKEFKEIYEQIIKQYPVNKSKVIFSAMSMGGSIAIDYAFNQFVPVSGLVLNCPVIPNISDSSINTFVDKNKKIAIITGENDWALKSQKSLIYKVDSLEGNSKITVNEGLGHQFAKDFSTKLDGYLEWILE